MTGKGGSGKTTLASALALALADEGHKVLLVELEGRQDLAGVFGIAPLPYGERLVTSGLGGGEVYGLAIDTEEAFLEYLEMFYRMGSAGKVLHKVGAVDFATTVAPGLKDILLTGKLKEITSRSAGGRWIYDAVVVDSPPTGRIARFLNVTVESGRLATTGPIGRHSRSVATLLHSPQTTVHIAALPTAMALQECLETVAELRAVDLPVGRVLLNQVVPDVYRPVERTGLEDALRRVGVEPDGGLTEALLAQYERRRGQVEAQRRYVGRLREEDVSYVAVPELTGGVDAGSLYSLAETIRSGLDGAAEPFGERTSPETRAEEERDPPPTDGTDSTGGSA